MRQPLRHAKPEGRVLGDIIKPSTLNILGKKEKEICLFNLRSISKDLDYAEMMFSEIELPPDKMLRIVQLVRNNRTRIKKVIWELTGGPIQKDLNLEKEE